MKPEIWQKVKEIFHHASSLPPEHRKSYLDEACNGQESVRAEVESLLSASEEADAFIEKPAIEGSAKVVLTASDPVLGRMIGPYRVIEEIGRGGMGTVYLAERADGEFARKVAIKIVKRGLDTDFILQRFRHERRILATLDHPNIARLLDGGATEDGLPYFVMEFVESAKPIDHYCDERKLSTSDRLRLFYQVCLAVGHAHRHRIIHRDIKPGNILITPDGTPKLLDFGIAKLMDREDGNTLASTMTAMGLMTPEYASPEQVRGEAVTPATDVYSLGVLLYELLTGHRPYKLKSRAPAEIAQVICGEEPPKPSTAVTRPVEVSTRDGTTTQTLSPEDISRVRDGEPSRLKRRLTGDLDSIILKALRKDHLARYPTADALAADIDRHLHDRPVDARKGAVRYRLGKFVRRHRVALAAAAVLLVSAPAVWYAARLREDESGTGPAAVTRRSVAVFGFRNLASRADKEWLSTALAEMFTTELAAGGQIRVIPAENVAQAKMDLFLSDSDSYGPGTLTRIRAVIGADLILVGSYLAAGDAAGSVRLDVRLQDAAVGETLIAVVENGSEANLAGLVDRSGATIRQKLGIGGVSERDALLAKATLPSNPEAARWYSEGLARLRLFDTLAARDFLEKAARLDPNHALTHSSLALALQSLGDDTRAREEAKRAFDLSSGLPRADRLFVEGRYYESIAQWDKAVDSYRALFGFFPDGVDYGLRLASAQTANGRGKDALASLEKLRALPKPSSDDPRIDLEEAYASEAISDFRRMQQAAERAAKAGIAKGSRVLVARAKLIEAKAHDELSSPLMAKAAYEEAQRIYDSAGHRRGVAMAISGLASLAGEEGNLAESIRLYEQSLAISREIGYKSGIASALNNIAIRRKQQGDFDAAARLHTEALEIRRQVGDKRMMSISLNNLANVRIEQGELAQAKQLYTEALDLAREVGERRNIARALHNLGLVLRFQGNLTAAKAMNEESIALRQEIGDTSGYAMSLYNFAQVLEDQGDLAGARKAYQDSLNIKTEQKDKRGIAYAFYGLGRIAAKSGDLDLARDYHMKALALRREMGEKNTEAQSMQSLAEIALEQNRLSEAESLARSAVAEYAKARTSHLEATAGALTAHILAARGKMAEALAMAGTLEPALSQLQYIEMALCARAHLARVYALAGRSDAKLASSVDTATQLGLAGNVLELRLAQLAAQRKSADALLELATQAESKNFRWIAQKARQQSQRNKT